MRLERDEFDNSSTGQSVDLAEKEQNTPNEVVVDSSKNPSLFNIVRESLGGVLKPVGGRFALTAGLVVLAVSSFACATSYANENQIIGDVDGNRIVDPVDAQFILQKEAGLINFFPAELKLTDTAIPNPTETNTPTDTPALVPTVEPSVTELPTDTPTNIPTESPTATPTPAPTSTPRETATNTPSQTPTELPTNTPTNTSTQTNTPTRTQTETSTNTPTETPKLQVPTIELLDESFTESERLASNLARPEDIAVNPVNGEIFVVKKSGFGRAEYVYKVLDTGVERWFPGAQDPFGGFQQTEIAINKNGELFVYSKTWIDQYIRLYDIETGEELTEIVSPFPPDTWDNPASRFSIVRSVAANPVDNKFYMSLIEDGPLVSFDPDTGSLEVHTPENISFRHGMCFDTLGTAYLGDELDEYLDKIPAGGDGERFEFENLREVVESIVGNYEEFNIAGLACDNSQDRILIHGYAITSDYLERGGTNYLPKIILAVDPVSHIVSPVAELTADFPVIIGGMTVDSEGSIFISTSNITLSFSEENGKIYKLTKN